MNENKQAEPVAWVPVKGFEDYYEISSEGVLRSKSSSHKGFSFKFEDSNHADHKKAVKINHPAPAVSEEPVGEIQIEDMGKPFNAARVRVHFYKEVPPVGAKIYTEAPAVAPPPDEVVRELVAVGAKIYNEVAGPDKPYSADSYLPLQFIDDLAAALKSAKEHGL